MRTCTTHPFCWIHSKSELGLRVKDSTIPNAGKGLFAEKIFEKNKKVVEYGGRLIGKEEMHKLEDTNPYLLALSKNKFIDAASTKAGLGRYANSSDFNRKKGNAVLSANPRNNTAWIKSVKKIKKGQEILVPYGKEYWKKGKPKK